jgi:hypothetical protein
MAVKAAIAIDKADTAVSAGQAVFSAKDAIAEGNYGRAALSVAQVAVTAKGMTPSAREVAGATARGIAAKTGTDFIVSPNGTAVQASQSKMKKSILDSGGKKVGDARAGDGEIFRMDTPHGPMDARIMDGTSGSGAHSGARTVFTEAGKDKVYVHPNGERIRGSVTKPERREIGHIHNQVNDR